MKQRTVSEPRRGVAAVELGFVLPFIMTLLLGLWEVGRMVEMQQILTNAAREGARQASTGNFTNTQIQTVVTNYLTEAGIPTANVVVNVVDNTTGGDVGSANYLDQLQVTVSIPYSDIRWSALSVFTPGPTMLSAQVVLVAMVDKNFGGFPQPPTG
jgi:Flp pilus assembly protein TadG